MSIPDPFHLVDPLLRALAEAAQPVAARAAAEAVADRLDLNAEQRAQRIPSGRIATYRHRTGWAQHVAKAAGLTRSPKHGLWEITKEGADLIARFPDGLPEDEVRRLRQINQAGGTGENGPTEVTPSSADEQSPEERIDQAQAELHRAVAQELLERIGSCSPEFFEDLVLDLLRKMGYGGSEAALQRVGGSGDGGIDGIIALDRLGLQKVYVQAKRWKDVVGRPEIQGFFGALKGRRAHHGVFLAASNFSREAREFAASVSDSIVLVDGTRLAELMIEHCVGVSVKRSVMLVDVDGDYFEEG